MKKVITLLCVLIMVIGLCGCGTNKADEDNEKYKSKTYNDAEIEAAISVATKYFDKYFYGCTLTEITYAGDEKTRDFKEWKERHNADEVIVLLSSFKTDESGGDGSLNPNSTYDGWNWILVRDKGGKWKHVDHGY